MQGHWSIKQYREYQKEGKTKEYIARKKVFEDKYNLKIKEE